jgi:Leucine-rich repeat (LRR) protein
MSNQIANLDVFFDNNTIEEIYIGKNALGKKLILKNVKNLNILAVAQNNLDSIELIGTDNIKQLYLQGNAFKNIKFKNLTNLDVLELTGNKELKTIDISSNFALSYLNLLSTAVSRLDVSNNKLLTTCQSIQY